MNRKTGIIFALLLAVAFHPLFGQEKKELSLTLEDSIVKALKNNLNVAVEVFNPELADASVARAKEIFLPQLDFGYGLEQTKQPSYWFIQGAQTISSRFNDYNLSLVQKIPTGGNFSLSLSSYKSDTNQAFQLINPRFGSTVRFEFTQPLLRNFGPKVNRREIIVARQNLEISEHQLKSVLMDTVFLVQEAYWNLAYAVENFKVKQQSLQLARDLLAKNKKEVEVGQLAPIEVLNAQTEVAQREADILQAEGMIRRGEDVFKTILNLAAEGDAGSQKIALADKPELKPVKIALDEAVREAMEKRPDLKMSKTTISTKSLNFSVAKNQLLPGLDLKLGYWSPGISGDRLIYLDDNPFLGIIVGKEKRSGSESLSDAFKFLYENWSVGVTLSVPIGDIISRSNYSLAKLDLEQSQAKLRSLEQQVFLEVSDAVRSIETDAKRAEAYRVAREFAEKRLEAETKKLNVGLTTNYFVLQYQEELANARSMEIKALVDYNISLSRLEKAMGASLDNRNISVTSSLEK